MKSQHICMGSRWVQLLGRVGPVTPACVTCWRLVIRSSRGEMVPSHRLWWLWSLSPTINMTLRKGECCTWCCFPTELYVNGTVMGNVRCRRSPLRAETWKCFSSCSESLSVEPPAEESKVFEESTVAATEGNCSHSDHNKWQQTQCSSCTDFALGRAIGASWWSHVRVVLLVVVEHPSLRLPRASNHHTTVWRFEKKHWIGIPCHIRPLRWLSVLVHQMKGEDCQQRSQINLWTLTFWK